jgi:GNAT superfamily N-acetyltransferase
MKMFREQGSLGERGLEMEGLEVVDFDERHEGEVLRIAGSAHEYNHFYADPNLPRELTDELFRRWVKRCINGLAKEIYVAKMGKEVAGFATFLSNERFNGAIGKKVAILDYIVLDRVYQGKGIGSIFLNKCLKAELGKYEIVELRTSHNNYSALNLYIKSCFQHISSDIIMHRAAD